MAAPLLIGSGLRHMPASDLRTYANEEVIAIDQDPLGVQGAPVWSNCPAFEPRDNWWNSPWSMPLDVAVMWSQALGTLGVTFISLASVIGRCSAKPRRACSSRTWLNLLGLFALSYIGVIWYFRPAVDECQQVWARPLVDGERALCFVNFASAERVVTCDAACLRAAGVVGSMSMRDVVEHKDLGMLSASEGLSVTLAGDGGSVLYRLTPLSE